MFEHRREPLLPRALFIWRVVKFSVTSLGLAAISLLLIRRASIERNFSYGRKRISDILGARPWRRCKPSLHKLTGTLMI